MNSKPLISIITATYNAGNDLEQSIASLREQSCRDFEWLIIDGGSKDNTLDIVEQNRDIVDFFVSETDDGVYDAFNKGVRQSKGEWVYFLGAGDTFYDNEVLETVAGYMGRNPDAEIVYGDVEYVSHTSRELIEKIGGEWNELKDEWFGVRPFIPPHQSVFHKATLFEKVGLFDTNYKIIADAKWFLEAKTLLNTEPLYIPTSISAIEYGGLSNDPEYAFVVFRESRLCNQQLGIKPPIFTAISAYYKLLRVAVIKKMLPHKVFCFVADAYRVLTGKKRRWTAD